MAEGWYCPGCKAHHGPHVDTCPKASEPQKLGPAVAGWPNTQPPVVGIPMAAAPTPGYWTSGAVYCNGNAVGRHYDYLSSLGLRQ